MNMAGSLIIGYDFSNKDKAVLIVGKRTKGQDFTVVNAFAEDEAIELYKRLTEPKKKEDK